MGYIIIRVTILRGGDSVFSDSTTMVAMKRSPAELVEYLFRETSFPGAVSYTGAGIIPPDSFTLHSGDAVEIAIDGIGILHETVA